MFFANFRNDRAEFSARTHRNFIYNFKNVFEILAYPLLQFMADRFLVFGQKTFARHQTHSNPLEGLLNNLRPPDGLQAFENRIEAADAPAAGSNQQVVLPAQDLVHDFEFSSATAFTG